MKLKRDLSLLHVFCIASGAMISSGIFILPGLAYSKAGPAVIICYFLAGLLSLLGMLSLAEMTTAMPQRTIELCDRVGRVMNYGDGVYGSEYVAAEWCRWFGSILVSCIL